MVTFEFVQPGEFEDPYYKVIDNKLIAIIFFYDEWKLDYISAAISSDQIDQIIAKIKQLNKDLK